MFRFACFAVLLCCSAAPLAACGDDDAGTAPAVDGGAVPPPPPSPDGGVVGPGDDAGPIVTPPPPPPVEGACAVTDVTSCGEIADPGVGCCQADGVAVFCDGARLVETDCAHHETSCGAVATWSMNHCVPTGAGRCADVVAPRTSGEVLAYDSMTIVWDMACWDDADGSLFVFVEDYKYDDIALRFLLFPGASGAPAQGVSYDLSMYSALAAPFFVSLLSGIAFDEGGSYDAEYLAYAGRVTVDALETASPVGSTLRITFDDLWAREVGVTSSSCADVPDGRRMHIERLSFEVPIGALHEDSECIEWAGG